MIMNQIQFPVSSPSIRSMTTIKPRPIKTASLIKHGKSGTDCKNLHVDQGAQIHSSNRHQKLYKQYRTGIEYLNDKIRIDEIVRQYSSPVIEHMKLNKAEKVWAGVLDRKRNNFKALTLEITECKINQANINWLIQFKWPHLKTLNLAKNQINPKCVKNLMHEDWPELQQLCLSDNKIGSVGLAVFVSKKWKKLNRLLLNNNQIAGFGLSHFMKSENWNLKLLSLDGNRVGTAGAKWLSKSNLKCLENLSLKNCYLSSKSINHIVKSIWPALNVLNLQKNYIGLKGIQSIAQNDWKQLSILDIAQRNYIEPCGILIYAVCSFRLTKPQKIPIKNDKLRDRIKYRIINKICKQ